MTLEQVSLRVYFFLNRAVILPLIRNTLTLHPRKEPRPFPTSTLLIFFFNSGTSFFNRNLAVLEKWSCVNWVFILYNCKGLIMG